MNVVELRDVWDSESCEAEDPRAGEQFSCFVLALITATTTT